MLNFLFVEIHDRPRINIVDFQMAQIQIWIYDESYPED